METFGDRVREARKKRGMTQKQLAAASGLSQTTISDIERGRNASSADIVALARAVGVSAEWLADGRGPRTLLTPDLPPPDAVRPEIAAVAAAHIRPAKAATRQGTLLTLSPAEHALLDAARPLSDDDLALLEQIARRMAGEGSGPPMESRDFLPPVPRLKKDKA